MLCKFYASGSWGTFYSVDIGEQIPVVGNYVRIRNSTDTGDTLKGKVVSVFARWRDTVDLNNPVWYAVIDTTSAPAGNWG